MTMEGKKHSGNGLLVGVLLLLVAVIVGLVARIVVVSLLPKSKYPSSMHSEKMISLNEQASLLDMEGAMVLYEEAIENAETDLEKEEVRVEYGCYLLDHNMKVSGFKQLDAVDDDALDAGYKILLYAALRDYYGSIEKTDMANEYNDKIGEVTKDSDYAAGG